MLKCPWEAIGKGILNTDRFTLPFKDLGIENLVFRLAWDALFTAALSSAAAVFCFISIYSLHFTVVDLLLFFRHYSNWINILSFVWEL